MIADIEELEKLDASENIHQKTECKSSLVNPKKMENLYFLWQMVQQNNQTDIDRKERESLSGESPWRYGRVST